MRLTTIRHGDGTRAARVEGDELVLLDAADVGAVLRGAASVDNEISHTFVYEGQKSGHGEKVDWKIAANLAKRGQMILAGGLSAGNVAAAIREVAPYGVDVSSAVESEPGRKNPAKIQAFVAAARITDNSNEE